MLKAHAPATATRRASFDTRARLAAAALAVAAAVGALVTHLFAGAKRGFLERDWQRHTQIAFVAAAEAEGAQDVAEDFVEAAEIDDVSARAAPTGLERRRPIAVVRAALVGVRQDLVREVDLGEAILSGGVALVLVGVMLNRQATKGGLDVGLGGIAANA